MQTQKMSLANIQGKLSRTEMKNIMAGRGSGGGSGSRCTINIDCGAPYTKSCGGGTITVTPRCYANPGTTTKTCHVAGCPS